MECIPLARRQHSEQYGANTEKKKLDKPRSVFALCYRLITHFPSRFPDRKLASKYSMLGIHPNAWSVAYLLTGPRTLEKKAEYEI
ncbi:hypothetical protein MY11210_009728 [Beauveria gryllotalpidicola]